MSYRVPVPGNLTSTHSQSHSHPQVTQFVYPAPELGMGHSSWLPNEYVVPTAAPSHPHGSWDYVSSQHDMRQLTPLEHMYRTQTALGANFQSHNRLADTGKEPDSKRVARNVREQRRTHRLTEQIDVIKTLLEEAQVPLKSNSKYHVLYACEQYIAQLQSKQDSLEAEKREAQIPVEIAVAKPAEDFGNKVVEGSSKRAKKRRRDKASNMPVEWKHVFLTARTPLAIAKPDGQVIAWNQTFENACGFTPNELGRLTIFSLVHPTDLQKMFIAVAECLQDEQHHNTHRSMRVYTRSRSPEGSTDSGERPLSGRSDRAVSGRWDISVTPVRDHNSSDPRVIRWLACSLTESSSASSTSEESSSNDNQSQSDHYEQSSNSPPPCDGSIQTYEAQSCPMSS